jgi:uncharacterized protein (DUF433 family)
MCETTPSAALAGAYPLMVCLNAMRSDSVGNDIYSLVSIYHQKGRCSMQEIYPGITADPKVRFGKPVIKGTRVPVDILVGKVAGGMAIDEVAGEYGVKPEDVRAALGYAAR